MKVKSVIMFILIYVLLFYGNPLLDSLMDQGLFKYLAIGLIAGSIAVIMENIKLLDSKKISMISGLLIMVGLVLISLVLDLMI